ncbi:hypothetical protein NPS01_41040 [Nocardioides psychrotolerans]|uniref:DinB superfamily protein n=1 Tax=Nocardioides psychrotolerans TaxID=1005945 RepID=A0A1I3RGH4_9ACTN|nr:DinB family protein [Nocardioides psychrotolerans]GEP40441.1 hypothetical protein NPS01_41040 [Nocardioides psychrotolerans]SFJ44451.1 DinB superfamily protein [Nocardioides psychrotolerans]
MSESPRREFVDEDLTVARFVRCDLSGAVLRAVDVQGVEIDAPWLMEEGGVLLVNGVNVAPLVDAELDRRFPGRAERRAATPEGLRQAWATLERTWTATLERAATMPAGTVDVSISGEWSFAQTLRHLVMATDVWLHKAIQELEQPYHPFGQPHAEYAMDGLDISVFSTEQPSYDEVLTVRAEHIAHVRDFIAAVTPELLAEERRNPWNPAHPETVLACLHVILNEEWEHHRFAVRDLDAIEAAAT